MFVNKPDMSLKRRKCVLRVLTLKVEKYLKNELLNVFFFLCYISTRLIECSNGNDKFLNDYSFNSLYEKFEVLT